MKKTFISSETLSTSLFSTFLKQNKAYDSYICNASNPDFPHGMIDLDLVTPGFYVSTAFRWSTTPEGADYWTLIDYKWNLVVDLFEL